MSYRANTEKNSDENNTFRRYRVADSNKSNTKQAFWSFGKQKHISVQRRTLLQIFHRVSPWKNSQNRSIFGDDMNKNLVAPFYGWRCTNRRHLLLGRHCCQPIVITRPAHACRQHRRHHFVTGLLQLQALMQPSALTHLTVLFMTPPWPFDLRLRPPRYTGVTARKKTRKVPHLSA